MRNTFLGKNGKNSKKIGSYPHLDEKNGYNPHLDEIRSALTVTHVEVYSIQFNGTSYTLFDPKFNLLKK